ncbi:MAG TPA: hypothetical protein VKV95_14830 [Terriglobia bacterium]|nr:hypothetical protein [Terriglobia bacterium]
MFHPKFRPSKQDRRIFMIRLICLSIAGFGLPAITPATDLVPYRAWQFHKLNPPYVSSTMKMAHNYDINTVVFSHDMIGYASQLFDGSNRGEQLRELARNAHAEHLKVWIWVHELQDVPQEYLDNHVVQLDRPGLWKWLTERYERVFAEYPEFDGLMLTFDETEYKIFDPKQVHSSISMPDRLARLINTINAVCERHGKDLIVRSFFYEPQEMEWFREGYAKTSQRVMIQSKCEPHDWDPFYPDNSLIGQFPGRRQIIEFDGSAEFFGKNRVPYTQPEYFERRWRYDLSKPGVAGYNLRLDHGGYDALRTPNEINIYAMYRFTQDPTVNARQIWKEWTEQRYGHGAAAQVEQALQPTYDIVNHSFYTLQFWVTNHSRLPLFQYSESVLHLRTMAKWYPNDARYAQLEQKLLNPDADLLEQILQEKDQAIALAHESLLHLELARGDLSPEQYADLYWRFALLERTAVIWRLHAEAFFGYKVLKAHPTIPGLRQRVLRALDGLEAQAVVSAKDARIGQDPPCSASEIRAFVKDMRSRLSSEESTP